MYLCHRYNGEKLRTIGDLFNVRESAMSEASRLFPRKMERDEKLGKSIEKIKGELNI
jgi:chromosomal replication initiation ATPase DnaA